MQIEVGDYLEVYKNCKAYHFAQNMMLDNDQKIVMGSIDIAVNTYCTMRCKGCASLISFYESRSNQNVREIIDALERLFENVNIILRVNILGGEPFLYPDLDKLVEYLNGQERVRKVYIMTNGTVVPNNPKLLEALQNSRNEVRISEYVDYVVKQNNIEEFLKSYNIKCTVKHYANGDFVWYDFGGFKKRDRTEEQRRSQMEQCSVEAQYLYNGRLYMCPRIAHGYELGIIPRNDEDHWIELAHASDDEIQAKLCDMIFRKSLFDACCYCDRGTDKVKIIPVAKQMGEEAND